MKTAKTALALMLILWLGAPFSSLAQATVGCANLPGFDEFDFWLGSWSVTPMAGGAAAGTNMITKIEHGCALHEAWTNANGGTGQSINTYNPLLREWRQVWVSEAAYMIDIKGGLEGDSMVLEGQIFYFLPQSGNAPQTLPFRGRWTPMADGDVRQTFEQFDPESDRWTVWFDGRYSQTQKAPLPVDHDGVE